MPSLGNILLRTLETGRDSERHPGTGSGWPKLRAVVNNHKNSKVLSELGTCPRLLNAVLIHLSVIMGLGGSLCFPHFAVEETENEQGGVIRSRRCYVESWCAGRCGKKGDWHSLAGLLDSFYSTVSK